MIDVIVPVYRGLGFTRRCMESVLAHAQSQAFELVVVDDATPEPAIAAWLDELAASRKITLLRNPANVGFVQSVNRGMSLHADRDVVLLNSDTEVVNDWLDRLAGHAGRHQDAATITPLSNNATICSYPFEGWEGGVPGTLGLAALDRLIATTNAGKTLDIPTAVGFCMLIRRRALAQLGLFDAARYGRGYGEENDFCMRAAKAGWRHLLAADVFVFHEGSVSFSDDRFALMKASAAALVEAHPDYPARVHDFVKRDPAAELRAAIDIARTGRSIEEAGHVVRERAIERERLLQGLWHIEQLAEQKESRIGQLDYALQHAMTQMTERDKLIARRDGEVAELRDALAYAEKLAFERQDELTRIHASRSWQWVQRLQRLKARFVA